MKIGIVGTGNVGCACAMAAVIRGIAREIVLVNRDRKTAEAVATDIRYGTPLGPKVDIVDGDYDALEGAGIVLITVGVNEKTGGATDRSDPQGRLKLLDKKRRHLSRCRSQDRAGGAQSGAARGERSARSARRCRTRDVPRHGGIEHRYISRQPALSRSSRQAFRRGRRPMSKRR